MARLLVVDDESGLRSLLEVVLRRDGHQVRTAANGLDALRTIEAGFEPEVVVTDLRMDGMSGIELLAELRSIGRQTFVIVMTAYADWATAAQAMRLGAYNFLAKPFDNEVVRAMVRRATDAREHYLATQASEGSEIQQAIHLVGSSEPMRRIQELIEQVSTTDATVLVTGESGTGKELAASAIHYASLRSDRNMVRVNSGALTPSLLESELFGHVEGAFTGAIHDRPGLFALADGGTLFLDEIGDLATETQVKLLRVLESGEYLPVGGSEVETCDVRVVAATNKRLKAMVAAGTFREDLYYRLAVIQVELPALRERSEDIPLLAGHLLRRHAVRLRSGVDGFTADALEAMASYRWPGNIRELDNRIQRGVALTNEGKITAESLFGDIADTQTGMWRNLRGEPTGAIHRPVSSGMRRATTPGSGGALEPRRDAPDPVARLRAGATVDLEDDLRRRERALIAAALEATDDNLTEAAKRLGITFRQIRYKVRQLGMR